MSLEDLEKKGCPTDLKGRAEWLVARNKLDQALLRMDKLEDDPSSGVSSGMVMRFLKRLKEDDVIVSLARYALESRLLLDMAKMRIAVLEGRPERASAIMAQIDAREKEF